MASTSEYWVGDMIGEGSFGIVVYGRYKQEQEGSNKQTDQLHVAIKCIDKHSLQKQPSMAMAVVQEQRLLKRLKERQQPSAAINLSSEDTKSENPTRNSDSKTNSTDRRNNNFIIDLYASFHDRECVYLVLECCCGGTLQDLLDHFQSTNSASTNNKCNEQKVAPTTKSDDASEAIPFTTTKFLLEVTQYYGLQLIMGISFIHACSIVHCDIKPSNVLLTNYGCIKISDFGSSIDLSNSNIYKQQRVVTNNPKTSSASKEQMTSIIIPRGSAAYAAPELNRQSPAQSRQNIDGDSINTTPNVAVDLWSLGCILYACLLVESNHQSPFDAGSEAMSIQAQKDYCDIVHTNSRYTKLFGKDSISLSCDSNGNDKKVDKEGELFNAFKGLIAALLHPEAQQRIKFAKKDPQKESSAVESSLSLQHQQDLSSVTNAVEDHLMLYPNLYRNTVWGMINITPKQPLTLNTDFLPPTPAWWIKNSCAVIPPKLTNLTEPIITSQDALNSSNPNVLVDGSIGWSAFLV